MYATHAAPTPTITLGEKVHIRGGDTGPFSHRIAGALHPTAARSRRIRGQHSVTEARDPSN